MKSDASSIAARVRSLRRRNKLTQVQLAERLGISAGYLNLIEHAHRPLSAALLIKLAQIFHSDLETFSPDTDDRLSADLVEAFGDRAFEAHDITTADVRDFVVQSPAVARGILTLYQAYRSAQQSAATLAMKVSEGEVLWGIDRWRLPTDDVNDLIQRHGNYFAELEAGAEMVWRQAGLSIGDMYEGLVRYLKNVEGVEVRVANVGAMQGALRRFDPERRLITISEVLRRGSRNFQIAHQLGLLTQGPLLDRVVRDSLLTGEAERMARIALASYFAAAVLMPYEPFLEAARSERYDIEVLGHRFRTSFEQVCHRLTTLRRPTLEGVPFNFVRVDLAGNVSKRFGASFPFARFSSSACPRWNVVAAFLTPGRICTQLSRFQDGAVLFSVARTVQKDVGGYHSPHTLFAVGIGCDVRHAQELVYADGVDLDNREAAVPVGVTCRLCNWIECEQRAFPPIQHPLKIDENVRGVSFYAQVARSLTRKQ